MEFEEGVVECLFLRVRVTSKDKRGKSLIHSSNQEKEKIKLEKGKQSDALGQWTITAI